MSVLKKIFSRDSVTNGNLSSNGGFSAMKPELQERLARGVKYNMKLVIRGERKTGKSALLSRLKGENFVANYTPTDEIQVGCILWNYRPTNDDVKIDIWDVVDKGRQREFKHGGISSGYVSKLTKKALAITAVASLDSSFIDVYKGANCAIIMFDITSKWTFEYVCRELPKVPSTVPVLIVGNFRDSASGNNECCREISEIDVRSLIRRVTKARQSASLSASVDAEMSSLQKFMCAPIRYCETSMQNGFGLMYIHRFLCVPFLHLQCANILQALSANRQAFSGVAQQLDLAEQNKEPFCSYEKFMHWLASSKGQNPQGDLKLPSQNGSLRNGASSGKDSNGRSVESPSKGVQDFRLPASVADDSAFNDFLQKVDEPKMVDAPSPVKHDLNGESVEGPSHSSPLVADFQEDLDPDDIVMAPAGGSNGVDAVTAPLNGLAFRPPIDSVDEDPGDEDDDDLMNSDEDDNEEQLGPDLGVTSGTANEVEDYRPQLNQASSISSSSSSRSDSSKKSRSTAKKDVVSPPNVDLGTMEERSAFERFLDGM